MDQFVAWFSKSSPYFELPGLRIATDITLIAGDLLLRIERRRQDAPLPRSEQDLRPAAANRVVQAVSTTLRVFDYTLEAPTE
jgi:hypothetical protein